MNCPQNLSSSITGDLTDYNISKSRKNSITTQAMILSIRDATGGIMTEKPIVVEEKKVACEICLKEIPASSAKHEEVQDYVAYFCGIDCFDQWQNLSDQEINK